MRMMKYFLILLLLSLLTACNLLKPEKQKLEYSYTIIEGNDTIEINTTWIDAGVKMYFNNNEVSVSIKSNEVDTTKTGVYQVTYKATFEETEYTVIRYVAVVDDTKPILQLNPGLDTIKVGTTWVDAGVSVSDKSNETLTYIVTGIVDTTKVGRYVITYQATDSSGNIGRVQRVVNVVQ